MNSLWSLNDVSLPGRQSPRLDRVTVEIPRGVTAVLGQSGAGKTSLLNVLVGFERPSSGSVRRSSTSVESPCLPLFWSPPTHGLWPHLTVAEHLLSVVENNGGRERGRAVVERLLAAFDLTPLSAARPGSLSQGERSRLSVARALASGARVLVMDEPLAHVDAARLGEYWAAIREYCTTHGTSLVFATHSPEVVLREASHVLCLTDGRLAYAGSVDELYHRPASPELAAMLGPGNWMTPEDAARWLEGAASGVAGVESSSPQPAGVVSETFGVGKDADPSHTSQKSGTTAVGWSAISIRPERLGVANADSGRFRVEAARFAGVSAEVDLVDERDGARRTFVHRPAGPSLRPGDRVLLKVLLLFIVALVAGCGDGTTTILPVKNESVWSMPSDGPRVPAPRGMTVSADGEYLVLDNAGRLLVFDAAGTLQRKWWMPEYSVGKAEGVCVLKDGRIAVADTHYHRVVLFNHDGEVVGMFGTLGTEPGEFIYPVSVTQDDKENLYICEYGRANDRCQKFRPDGTFVTQIGSYGTDDGQFQRPSGAAWFDGRLYIVDAFNNRVQVFDGDGKLMAILGGTDKQSDLYYPYDIAVTDRGELYIVEYGAGRVSKLDRSGKLLGRYGHTGTGSGEFKTPWGLAVDRRGRVYVCDTGNHRIVELEM